MRLDKLVGSFVEGKRPSVLCISGRVATAGEMPNFLFFRIFATRRKLRFHPTVRLVICREVSVFVCRLWLLVCQSFW